MSSIKISTHYLKILKSLLKIYNDLPNNKHALIFKTDGSMNVSAMNLNRLVCVQTTSSHVDFDDDEIGIPSLPEFLNYITAIEYPDSDKAAISRVEETSTKGKRFDSFLFEGNYGNYRMVVAHPKEFDARKDRKVPSPIEKDPLKLVAKFVISPADAKFLVKDIQLMGKAENFNLAIDGDTIKIYMKGVTKQQFSRTFKGMDVKVYDGYETKKDGKLDLKVFPSKIFDYMSYFGCGFEIEIRTLPDDSLMALKCRGTISNENVDDINIFIGTQENSSEVCNADLDIIE